MGDHARAEGLYRQAIAIQKVALEPDHPDYATSLNNLAVLLADLGEYTRAAPLRRKVIEIQAKTLGKQHPDYASSLGSLARGYYYSGDYARAEPLFRRQIEIHKAALGIRHPDYARSLADYAMLCESMTDYRRAESLSTEAVDIVRQHLNNNALVQSERQQKRNQSLGRAFLDRRLSLAARTGVATADVSRIFWEWKGATTGRQRVYRQVAANPKLAPLFAELQSTARMLSAAANDSPDPPALSAEPATNAAHRMKRGVWEKRVAALTREREKLQQEIAAVSVEFRNTQEPMTADIVKSYLPERTAFIDFLEYNHGTPDPEAQGGESFERRYIALLVRPEREPVLVGLGNAESMGRAIANFRRPFSDGSDAVEAADAAARLRKTLWLPLEEHLDGIDTVVVSPDTMLGTLPFAALPGNEPGTYLIEQYRFASLPLANLLRPLFDDESRRHAKMGLLAIGDVAYGRKPNPAETDDQDESRPPWLRAPTQSGNWPRLPSAGVELASVERTFRKKFGGAAVTTLDATAATEEAFMAQAPRHSNVHIVTHGFFASPAVPAIGAGDTGANRLRVLGRDKTIQQYVPGLLCGLVLAGANDPPVEDDSTADGILTASEIEALDLNAVDLVVLSACDTGLGRTAGGEGLTGLQRAFHIAGARSVIASLWAVDDAATTVLMSRFYRYYWEEGRSKIDALRQAQLDLLNDSGLTRGTPKQRRRSAVDGGDTQQSFRASPRYWGGFVLSGDWGRP